MPSRHSKNCGDRAHFTHNEKRKSGFGIAQTQRLGSESQLPFGHCCLSLHPAEDPVVSPSGHIYSRESIVEYLLAKSKDLKEEWKQYEKQQAAKEAESRSAMVEGKLKELSSFVEAQDQLGSSMVRKAEDFVAAAGTVESRKRKIDETERTTQIEEFKHINPWLPQFTPTAAATELKEPPKRPPSPISGRPLKSKDLISLELMRESPDSEKFIDPVTRKTITTQKVILIKSLGTYMLEQTAQELAYPTLTCPITGKKFNMEDVLPLASALSGYAATGKVEVKIQKHNLN